MSCVCPPHIAIDKDGYPRAKHQGKIWRLNRLIYTFSFGPIPEGSVIGHSCNNKGCINIEHLYLTTAVENSTHAARDGLYASGDSHHRTKRSDSECLEIYRRYYFTETTQTQLAKEYHTSQPRIREALYRAHKLVELSEKELID